VRTLPAGTAPFQFAAPHNGFSLTPDGSRFATAEAVRAGRDVTGFRIIIHDAHGAEIAAAVVPDAPLALALSPDGTRLAVIGKNKTPVRVIDSHGAVIDEVPAEDNNLGGHELARPIAWDPTGTPRIAYYRGQPARVVIRDVVQRKEIETRLLARPNEGRVREIVWSPDGQRLALLADQVATVWDGANPPTVFALVGAGGVELAADGHARLLGDLATARSLLTCAHGGIVTAGVSGCDTMLVP
jgi:hypothetical protein